MKPTAAGSENVVSPDETAETATPAKARCTPCCTETADGLDELARAVRLVAGMKGLTDDQRQAVLDRLLDGDKPK
jgi:hypothetical protein